MGTNGTQDPESGQRYELRASQDSDGLVEATAALLIAVLRSEVVAWNHSYGELTRPLSLQFQESIMATRSANMTAGVGPIGRRRRDFAENDLQIATLVLALLNRLARRETMAPTPSGDQARERSGLTHRELEVLGLVADGHSARAAAQLLHISPATIRKHLERAYAKLEVHDKMNAVRRAREQGIDLDAASRGDAPAI